METANTKTVNVGDKAPDFKLEGTGGRSYTLSELGGKPIVLVFYPGDATPVCTDQLTSYTEDFGQFTTFDAGILALSPQNIESHESFHSQHNFAFPLLYDEDKRVGEAYGVVGPLGFYRRSVFVVDESGTIRFVSRSTAGLGYTRTDDIIRALKEL